MRLQWNRTYFCAESFRHHVPGCGTGSARIGTMHYCSCRQSVPQQQYPEVAAWWFLLQLFRVCSCVTVPSRLDGGVAVRSTTGSRRRANGSARFVASCYGKSARQQHREYCCCCWFVALLHSAVSSRLLLPPTVQLVLDCGNGSAMIVG
jgi:hypothetical protein